MKVKLLLTPSARIQGLPKPIPRAGQTADLEDSVAEALIARGIAVAVKQPVKRQAAKPRNEPIKPVEKQLKPKESE